jgi:16S rRNA (cytosine1402-N4)-methyltransferase
MQHKTVLLHEAIDGLDIKAGDVFVDGTLGGGGHSEEVIRRFGDAVKIIAIDEDREAIERSKARFSGLKSDIYFVQDNFKNIDNVLQNLGQSHADKILFDIGLSSNQFEDSKRGFSFKLDEPLLMSFKKDLTPSDLTAREIVNNWDLENISAILSGYGEEQFAWKIAKAIVERRKLKPIETTNDLVEIIMIATPKFYHHKKIHPATKTFQALRITVNDEINNLKRGTEKAFQILASNGRLAVISFHSLEDRVVKHFFKSMSDDKKAKIITKRPIVPTSEEIEQNPRSRSAKLRIIQKI